MKKWLLEYFKSFTFNTCPHQPLPSMYGLLVAIHEDKNAETRVFHTATPVSLHWQKKVKFDLLQDEALCVIWKLPYVKPTRWCHRIVMRKHDGSPFSLLNKYGQRETFSSESSFHIARRISGNTWKTFCDAWNECRSTRFRWTFKNLHHSIWSIQR